MGRGKKWKQFQAWTSTCILSHNTFCPTLQLWPTLYQVLFIQSIHFSLLNVLELSLHSTPFSSFFFSLGFLHSWCKNSGHSLMVFLHLFGSQVIMNKRKEVTRPIPYESKVWGKFDSISFFLLPVFLSSFSLGFSSFCWFLPIGSRPLLHPYLQVFNLLSSSPFSLSCLRKEHVAWVCSDLFGKEERGQQHTAGHMELLQLVLGRGRVALSLSLFMFIPTLKWGRVFRCWIRVILTLVLGYLRLISILIIP